MKWVVLAAASIVVSAIAQALHVPAAWLIGPMVTAIALAIRGFGARLPQPAFVVGMALIAVTVSQTITTPILVELAHLWLPIVAVVACSVVAAGVSAWLLARYSPIDPDTAAWGSTPGGATTMTILAAAYGADARLVAFMQFLRVTLVVLTASLVSRALLGGTVPVHHPVTAAGPFQPLAFIETLAVAAVAALIGKYSRVPGGQFLVPLILAGVLHATGLFQPFMPWWLLDVSYALVGISIGLLFDRATLLFAIRMLPMFALSTAILIALSFASGLLLIPLAHADLMTAYLATTPGGLDSIPVIGLDVGANLPLILATQTTRVFAVVFLGPPLARLIIRLTEPYKPTFAARRAAEELAGG
jgi:membrane AbrB-like protein